jgi:hypothetical protein
MYLEKECNDVTFMDHSFAECGATVVPEGYASLPEHGVPKGSVLNDTWSLLGKLSSSNAVLEIRV